MAPLASVISFIHTTKPLLLMFEVQLWRLLRVKAPRAWEHGTGCISRNWTRPRRCECGRVETDGDCAAVHSVIIDVVAVFLVICLWVTRAQATTRA